MKTRFFDLKHSIFIIIGYLATFKLTCDSNRIQERAAMWVLPHYVNETPANALNSSMCATDKSSPINATVRNADNRSRKLLQSNPELVSSLPKHFPQTNS